MLVKKKDFIIFILNKVLEQNSILNSIFSNLDFIQNPVDSGISIIKSNIKGMIITKLISLGIIKGVILKSLFITVLIII